MKLASPQHHHRDHGATAESTVDVIVVIGRQFGSAAVPCMVQNTISLLSDNYATCLLFALPSKFLNLWQISVFKKVFFVTHHHVTLFRCI